jgi:hypothetical protein
MTPDEARTLSGFLKGAFPSITTEQEDVYTDALLFEDAALASKAILDGIRDWKFPPRYAEIVERIRALKKEAAPPAPEPTLEEEEEFKKPIAFWVRRWVAARFMVKPPDMRPFPEQYVDSQGQLPRGEQEWMPANEYDEAAKKITDQQVRAAVAHVPLADLLGPT